MSASVVWYPTNVDGRAGREGASESFATIIGSNGNANDSSNANIVMRLQSAATAGNWAAMRRGFFSFDPTDDALPAGAIITAVSLSLHCVSTGSNNFTQSMCLTKGTLASSTAIASADYQGTKAGGQTEYSSRVAVSALSAGARSTWTLNATGIAAVQAASDAATALVFALYFSADLDATEPTWGMSLTDDVSLAANDTGGTVNDPTLTVTYRIGPGHAVLSLTGTLANTGDTVNANFFNIEVWT